MSYFSMNNYYIFVIKCRRWKNRLHLVGWNLGRMRKKRERKWRGKEINQGVWLGHGGICGRKIGEARVFSAQAHQNVSAQIGEITRKKNALIFGPQCSSVQRSQAKQNLRDNFLLSFPLLFSSSFLFNLGGKKKSGS